ncbi:hypothetical protein OH77DRAFT_1432531 [Trametes cingulata]|nr:hypothetical protein OH77DRAFT_1432531 [Trametes cingulata]
MSIHAVTHSVQHCDLCMSCTEACEQHYARYTSTVALSIRRRPSRAVHLHTSPVSESERLKSLSRQSQPMRPLPVAQTRDTEDTSNLVDQAVKSLCGIWRLDNIPTVFTACGRESLCAQPKPPTSHADSSPSSLMTAGLSKLLASRSQLPSPVSPMSRPSSSPPADGCESYSQAPESSGGSNLIPIRGFVHEVLCRSRTSTGVLQTALCYLEAVHAKVPELLRKEKARPTSERYAEEEAELRIVQGLSESDVPQQSYVNEAFAEAPENSAGPTLDTIRVDDANLATEFDADDTLRSVSSASRRKDQSHLPPLPPLPSPLCCPRRTFLACLILVSKFMQDRSYSNRAWAKLAGLPPREIGRCERAVGKALEWRLWVSKLPNTSSGSAQSCAGCTLSITRSDGDLLAGLHTTCSLSVTAAWASATIVMSLTQCC